MSVFSSVQANRPRRSSFNLSYEKKFDCTELKTLIFSSYVNSFSQGDFSLFALYLVNRRPE